MCMVITTQSNTDYYHPINSNTLYPIYKRKPNIYMPLRVVRRTFLFSVTVVEKGNLA